MATDQQENKELKMLNVVNEEIKKAMFAKDQVRLPVLKMIKSELINNEKTAKPKSEISVVVAYKKKLSSTIEINKAHNIDTTVLDKELEVVSSLLPPEPTEQEILDYASSLSLANKNAVLKEVLAHFPTANGKMVSELVMKMEAK